MSISKYNFAYALPRYLGVVKALSFGHHCCPLSTTNSHWPSVVGPKFREPSLVDGLTLRFRWLCLPWPTCSIQQWIDCTGNTWHTGQFGNLSVNIDQECIGNRSSVISHDHLCPINYWRQECLVHFLLTEWGPDLYSCLAHGDLFPSLSYWYHTVCQM